MNQRLKGIMIRRLRLERNWSQATMCADICAVSYLSRIEQGQVGGSPEVLAMLMERLGVTWREDPAFCRESAAWFDDCYDRLFAGESIEDMVPVLKQRWEEFRYSPFFPTGCCSPGRLRTSGRRRRRSFCPRWTTGNGACTCAFPGNLRSCFVSLTGAIFSRRRESTPFGVAISTRR